MGYQAYHLCGGAGLKKKFKIAATIVNAGIPILSGAAAQHANYLPTAATTAGPFIGLGLDTATYSSVQGAVEGVVAVDVRPDLVIGMSISGGATEGTALTLLSNTSASSGGTTITDSTNVPTVDLNGGTVFAMSGGSSAPTNRSITAWTTADNFVVNEPFPVAIAVGDTFIAVPFNTGGSGADSGADGMGDATLTTLFTQVRQDIAVGDGVDVAIIDLVVTGVNFGRVYFTLRDHVFGVDTI